MKIGALMQNTLRTLVALVIVTTAGPAFAATASELFADGNRLFRDDLYWAALLRYGEAADAGMDTPLLHYNMGVANYKAQQYVRARESLEKAATYGPLAPISQYNLGLNAYALNDYDEALKWFRLAANQDQQKDLSRMARRAIRQLQERRQSETPAAIQVAIAKREREFTNLDFRIRTGAGVDDNVFRSPSEPYIDLSDPNNPVLVTPEVQSGVYVPVSLSAKYQVNAMENEGFFGSYRFGGRFYQDEALKNGDEHLHEIGFGSEFRKREDDRETRVYSAFKIAQHEETYYDPDDGASRSVNGTDISDRLSYLRYGPEFWARKRYGRFTFGIRTKGQLWNYEDVETVPAYDHEYWSVGLNTDIRLSPTSILRMSGEYYTRRYGDRPAFELDGTQPLGNPSVRYDYIQAKIEARQRITDAMWFGIGYARTDREDRHVGYNSYVRDQYFVQYHLRIANRFRIDLRGRYFNYNYENAFAYHEPTAGRKTMESAIGSFVASYRMTDSLDLVAEYHYRDVQSNDERLAYGRSQAILAVRWSQ
ncbi:MAG: hypothetical protein OEM63_02435 [Gammaproteobacteria bacterium]|nr:hypothetical protein [Gammaproteobacteria bacterium]